MYICLYTTLHSASVQWIWIIAMTLLHKITLMREQMLRSLSSSNAPKVLQLSTSADKIKFNCYCQFVSSKYLCYRAYEAKHKHIWCAAHILHLLSPHNGDRQMAAFHSSTRQNSCLWYWQYQIRKAVGSYVRCLPVSETVMSLKVVNGFLCLTIGW